ncbi:MAG TPA: hypothetical protein VLF67_03330, partial [Candidatus Saccharimonas sp.]|nr:hypothetical protein [Candidatus Saccharimonas sp.]
MIKPAFISSQSLRIVRAVVFSLVVASAISLGSAISNAPIAQAACTALPTNNGTASFSVTIPSTATYRFWAHMYSPSSGNNAMYLQVDSTYCSITVGNNNSMPVGTFTWVDYQNGTTSNKINMSLTTGPHSVTLAGLDPGVGVDKVMFASDTACVPTGDGSNCVGAAATPTPSSTPSPTVVITPSPGSTPAPGGGTPVSGTITLPQSSAPGTGRSYYIDGKPVSSSQIDTTKLTDGQHTLKIVDTTPDGKQTVSSQKLDVHNFKGLTGMVLAWLSQPLNLGLFVIAILLLGGVGWWLWRAKLMHS